MLQTYSALPFNITSAVTTIQGTTGRPTVNGAHIERNAGVRSDFFSLNVRISRAFRVTVRVQVEGVAEGFNLTNHQNVLRRNTNFGPGAYPTNPSSSFRAFSAVGEPRTLQLPRKEDRHQRLERQLRFAVCCSRHFTDGGSRK